MARALHKLTDTFIRAKDLPAGRYSDGGGLYLYASGGANRSWVFVGIKNGKRFERGLGAYPSSVSLASAREKAADCRRLLRAGLDPTWVEEEKPIPTFAQCTDDFLKEAKKGWTNPKHKAQWEMTLGDAYCSSIRKKAVSDVATADVVEILKPIWTTKPETAQRLRGRIERVLDYARVHGYRTGENPALWRGHLQHLLARPSKLSRGHHSAMHYDELPALSKALAASEAISSKALLFLILTAARTGEVREATWAEIELNACVWTVPKERMKARREHRVPLGERATAIVTDMLANRVNDYVFPGQKKDTPLSNMSMSAILRRMDLGHFTVHGFRSSFRDWAGDKTSFPREIAETALAHVVGDETEAAYRRSDALQKRRRLMVAWENYLFGDGKRPQNNSGTK